MKEDHSNKNTALNRQIDRGTSAPSKGGGRGEPGAQGTGTSSNIPNFSDRIAAPSINLPKGGGAIQGIGEKFQMSPVTGTGSMTVPVAISPGRAGFAPALALSYDSGSGNSPFGLGWNIGLPAISRKTQQGLPRYRDTAESDTFILSGAEDLVPILNDLLPPSSNGFQIKRYRPRIEGLFARIERWTAPDGIIHWRSISKENITTVYGESEQARIADPADRRKIFQWNIEHSYDDKGNVLFYVYQRENADGISNATFERNRRGGNAYTQIYLKRILYGNEIPYNPATPVLNANTGWHFELVFDFGEHTSSDNREEIPTYRAQRSWPTRPDVFSSFRSGFDIRTHRLCRRILMFHRFPELGADPSLVKSTELFYNENGIATQLQSVQHRSFDGTAAAALPPVEFSYSAAVLDPTVRHLDVESLENLPVGIDNSAYQFVDLEGEGLSGVLSQYPDAWYYKRNLGDGHFGPKETVGARPSLAVVGQLTDLDGDGQLNLVVHGNGINGYYELDDAGRWGALLSFPETPNVNWGDPNLRFIDLDGDGHADILITENDCLVWYASKAKEGYADLERVAQFLDEEQGPRLVFHDGTQTIFLADMVGDGLTDLVRIRNGEVCYWANMGYGRFSPKIQMANAPTFDHPEQFDPGRLRLADIDGDGTTDILYLGKDLIQYWHNQSGNSWVPGNRITHFPKTDNLSQVQVLDLLGKGTACLVWSSPLPNEGYSPVRYIDLMAGTELTEDAEAGRRVNCKPYLLTEVRNNMGAITRLRYEPSTKFYLEDRRNGTPWITKLPFPVQVLCRTETFDDISKNAFVSRYAYHHGYFDGVEREFRGFGMVEQWDTEDFAAIDRNDNYHPPGSNWSEETDVPPVYTKTWFHTGFYRRRNAISDHFRTEYFQGDPDAWLLPDTVLPENLSIEEAREAARALKGSALRQEVYARDGSSMEEIPYTVAENSYHIRRLQPRGDNKHAVFFITPSETLTYHYERNALDPRIGHQLTLDVDDFGNVTRSAVVVYPRRNVPGRLAEQTIGYVTYSESEFINRDEAEFRRIGIGWMQKTFEVQLPSAAFNSRFECDTLRSQIANAATRAFHEALAENQKRLLNCALLSFYNAGLTGELPFGDLAAHALPFKAYQAAFTRAILNDAENGYGGRVGPALLESPEAGYLPVSSFRFSGTPGLQGLENTWWSQSGQLIFDRARFFLPVRQTDPFGQATEFRYDDHSLLLTRSFTVIDGVTLGSDAANNYRLLQPWRLTDPNGNISEVAFDTLGMVVLTVVRDGAGQGDIMPASIRPADFARLYPDRGVREDEARALLGTATSRLVYRLDAYLNSRDSENPQPNFVHTITRERHLSDPGGGNPRLQHALSYSDGFGRAIMAKVQAEPGDARTILNGQVVTVPVNPRWVGNGRTVFNNKGNPVKQYEPYFSVTHQYEAETELVEYGVTPVLHYDPLGRNIRTDFPDGTHSRVEFTPWMERSFDQNDTVLDSQWYVQRGSPDPSAAMPTEANRRTAWLAAQHANTPAQTHLDTLGRPFLTIAHNRIRYADSAPVTVFIPTRTAFDIIGNPLEIYDGRRSAGLNEAQALTHRGNRVVRYRYAMNGAQILQDSMDAGVRRGLSNVAGNPIRHWDGMGRTHRTRYDALQRPTHQWVTDENGRALLAERMIYGERAPNAAQNKLRGQLYLHFDGAGLARNENFDFKGNPERSSRRLCRVDYAAQRADTPAWQNIVPNWQTLDAATALNAETLATPLLETETFTLSTRYDALNRPRRVQNHHDGSVQYPLFNEAGLLDRLRVNLRGAATVTDETEAGIRNHASLRTFIENIDYDAKGQRERIRYDNGVTTRYTYDEQTFRLLRIHTTRNNGAETLQDLHYTYDPVGNIIDLTNNAIEPVFFRNQMVDGRNRYTYDALYQLIEAEGRENHTLQGQSNHREIPEMIVPQFPVTDRALRNYRQVYRYDPAGNILEMQHIATGGSWTRTYEYAPFSNRLTATRPPYHENRETYDYDAHGNMRSMPHLQGMTWDYKDQMAHVHIADRSHAFYSYDSGRQRVRKVVFNGDRRTERIYLGGFEIFRVLGVDGTSVQDELQTLHIMDDKQRVCMVETTTIENGVVRPPSTVHRLPSIVHRPPSTVYRYQLSNHLGSSTAELDEQARVITYEEYHPYGSTAFRASRSGAEVSAKRYRYTGMERDEETGLGYHGARYYVGWLGRWVSADPAFYCDGWNLFVYCNNIPNRLKDTNGKTSTSDNAQELLKDIKQDMEKQHGYYRGTMEATLAEAQGLNFPVQPQGKEKMGGGGKKVVHTHKKSLEDTIENAKKNLEKIGKLLEDVGKKHGGDVHKELEEAFRPLQAKLRKFIKTGHETLSLAEELSKSHPNRLRDFSVNVHRGRTESSLISQQLGEKNRKLLPDAYSKQYGALLEDIKELPVNANSAKNVYNNLFDAAKKGINNAGRILKGALKRAIPVIGIYFGLKSAEAHASEGEYGRATLDIIGFVVDPVDLALLAWDLRSEISEAAEAFREGPRQASQLPLSSPMRQVLMGIR